MEKQLKNQLKTFIINMIGLYCLVGFIYVIINIFFREMNEDGDWSLVFVWLFMWPICFTALLIKFINDRV